MPGSSSRLHVRVAPGSGRSTVVGRYGRGWKVRVAPAAERGRANAALVELLADVLSIPRNGVELVAGHGSRDKVVALSGLTEDEASRRLDRAAGASA